MKRPVQDTPVNRLLTSLRTDVFRSSASRFYTHWSAMALLVSMLLSLFGIHYFLPAAIANASAVSAIAVMGYSLSSDFDIPNTREASRRRAAEFSCHILPLLMCFGLVLYVLPRIPAPSVPVSMAIILLFGTAYLMTPTTKERNTGRAKLIEVYGADYTLAIAVVPALSFLLLTGMPGKK